MAAASSGDPGGSAGRRMPAFMDPTNKFGEITYLQLTGKNDAPLPKDPFMIAKSVEQTACGPIHNAKTEAQGTRYCLMVRDAVQVRKLLQMNCLIDGTEVTVQAHPNLNVSRCVISSYDFIHHEEADILRQVISQGVIRVQRITRNEEGKRVNTPALILTFCRTTYPQTVKVGLMQLHTRPYFPNPLLCFGCFSYGHPKVRCPGPQRCSNCSGDHQTEVCDKTAFCRNCKGTHKPTSRQCPIYKREVEVIRVKVRENLTFPEARKRVESQRTGTYAQITNRVITDQSKLDELLTLLKKKDEQITQLMDAAKKNEARMEQMLNQIENQKQHIAEITNTFKLQPKQLTERPCTRSQSFSPVPSEGKRGRPRKQRSPTSKPTLTAPERESPPPKRTAVTTIDLHDDFDIEETPPSQHLR